MFSDEPGLSDSTDIPTDTLTPLQDALRAVSRSRIESWRAERRLSSCVFENSPEVEVDEEDEEAIMEAMEEIVDGIHDTNECNIDTPMTTSITLADEVDESSSCTASIPRSLSDFKYHFRRDRVDDILPEEVRWFYRAPIDKLWSPFIGYDSLRIETKYRELQRSECAHCLRKLAPPSFRMDSITSIDEDECMIELTDSCKETIIVRGGMFEVDVLAKKMTPIYWSGVMQTMRIMRGIWFKGDPWQPLGEDLAEQIENEHLNKFSGQSMTDLLSGQTDSFLEKKRNTVVHTLRFSEFHIDWYQANEVYLYSESTSFFLRQKLGMQKVGTRLRRGYHNLADMSDRPPDITHLCFVIHGIGQKILTGAIIKCCDDLRVSCEKVKSRHFHSLDADNQRVEFLPVEWRSALRLDGDAVSSITPHHVRGLRTLLNSTAMDILYYTSPLYRGEIIQGLSTELNRLYSMFCARNPYFEASGGRASIIAHSLGTVITYDILMGGENSQSLEKMIHTYRDKIPENQMEDFVDQLKELTQAREKVTQIEDRIIHLTMEEKVPSQTAKTVNIPNNFKTGDLWKKLPKLEHFFCLGSPLAVFIALRGYHSCHSGDMEQFLPSSVCERIYNLYHPADPVAYRIEPLLLRHYGDIHPVSVHRFDSPSSSEAYQYVPLEVIRNPRKKRTFQVPHKSIVPSELNGTGDTDLSKEAEHCCDDVMSPITASSSQEGLSSDNLVSKQSPSSLGSRLQSLFQKIRGPTVTSPTVVAKPPIVANVNNEVSTRPGTPDLMQFEEEKVLVEQESHTSTNHSSTSFSKDNSFSPSSSTYHLDSIPSNSDSVPKMVKLDHRIDYELRSSRYENSYLAVLTSHTAYWTNPDVAMFIMTHLFPDQLQKSSMSRDIAKLT